MTRILVFGASTTYGAWDREGGWADRLKRWVHGRTLDEKDFYCLLYNVGISGDTTADILERFELDTKMRMKEGEDAIFIFSVGVNDSQFVHSKNALRRTPEDYGKNLQKLFALAKKFSSKIVFVGFYPVDESKVDPIPWNTDKSYKNKYIREFNAIAKGVCAGQDVIFVDILDEWTKIDYKKLLEDGVHPNTEGHKKIFESVKNALEENKII